MQMQMRVQCNANALVMIANPNAVSLPHSVTRITALQQGGRTDIVQAEKYMPRCPSRPCPTPIHPPVRPSAVHSTPLVGGFFFPD